MKNKKVSIIGSVGLPAKYGGWETLVSNLTFELGSIFDLTVFCSSKKYKIKLQKFNGANLRYINLRANGPQSIPYDIISIYKSFKFADTILILGVSGCIFLPFISLFGTTKIVVNIDGLEWKRDKWGKFTKYFLKFSELLAVKFSHVVIADNVAIQRYIFDEYGVTSKLIAYGGDHASKIKITYEAQNTYKFLTKKYAIKVCRIESENNVDIILDSFYSTNSLPLVVVGNWNDSSYGLKLKSKYSNAPNIFLLDAIYDQNQIDMLRSNAFLYVHGHSAGGTNPSLVEAMNLKLAIIAYDVSFNRETTENKSLYFKNKNELIDILNNINEISLSQISEDMRLIAVRRYSWKVVASQYAELF